MADPTPLPTRKTRPVLLTGAFWADTFERVVTAVASVAIGTFGATVVSPENVDWGLFGWSLLFTAVARLLLCIVARNTGDTSVPNASFFLTAGKKVT